MGRILCSIRETPEKGTLLSPTSGSPKRDLIERVFIPKGPPNPNSHRISMEVSPLLWPKGLWGLPYS